MTRINGEAPAYYLFVDNATFSWRATLSEIVAISATDSEPMALASCCYEVAMAIINDRPFVSFPINNIISLFLFEVVWARKHVVKLGFAAQAY